MWLVLTHTLKCEEFLNCAITTMSTHSREPLENHGSIRFHHTIDDILEETISKDFIVEKYSIFTDRYTFV